MSGFRFEFKNEKHRARWFKLFAKDAERLVVVAYLMSQLSGAEPFQITSSEIYAMDGNSFFKWACDKAKIEEGR